MSQNPTSNVGGATSDGLRSPMDSETLFENKVPEDAVNTILNTISKCPHRCLKFYAKGGAHYVTSDKETYLAVFAGPHGPENKAARIDRENIERLFSLSHKYEVIQTDESPFVDIEIASDIKKS